MIIAVFGNVRGGQGGTYPIDGLRRCSSSPAFAFNGSANPHVGDQTADRPGDLNGCISAGSKYCIEVDFISFLVTWRHLAGPDATISVCPKSHLTI